MMWLINHHRGAQFSSPHTPQLPCRAAEPRRGKVMGTMAGEKTTSQGYPGKVCVLDLETSKLVRGEPQATPLAFVGTMVYELHDVRYRPGPHRYFLPDELGRLEELLRDFGSAIPSLRL